MSFLLIRKLCTGNLYAIEKLCTGNLYAIEKLCTGNLYAIDRKFVCNRPPKPLRHWGSSFLKSLKKLYLLKKHRQRGKGHPCGVPPPLRGGPPSHRSSPRKRGQVVIGAHPTPMSNHTRSVQPASAESLTEPGLRSVDGQAGSSTSVQPRPRQEALRAGLIGSGGLSMAKASDIQRSSSE